MSPGTAFCVGEYKGHSVWLDTYTSGRGYSDADGFRIVLLDRAGRFHDGGGRDTARMLNNGDKLELWNGLWTWLETEHPEALMRWELSHG